MRPKNEDIESANGPALESWLDDNPGGGVRKAAATSPLGPRHVLANALPSPSLPSHFTRRAISTLAV